MPLRSTTECRTLHMPLECSMLDPHSRVRRSVRICILKLFLQIFFALFLLRQHIINLFLQLCAVIADGAGGSKSLGPGLIIGSRASGRLLRFISVATDQQK